MRDQHPRGRLRAPAILAAGLAAVLALAWSGGGALAQDDDEEENLPLDTKIFRQIMKDFGATRDGPQIEYRERAPLVVPPSRNLPPPRQAGAAAAANPAWPKDSDVAARHKRATAAERAKLKGTDSAVEDARPLRPDELSRGRAAAAKSGPAAPGADEAGRPLSPSQLGTKKTFFDSLFSAFTPGKPESVPFSGEPPRASMTEPPAGYQIPSPDHPYGVGPTNTHKTSTVVDRVENKN
jgi:hypothetical protein